MSKLNSQLYDLISFEEFYTNDIWVLQDDFSQLTLEEDEIIRKEEEAR